MKILIDDFLLEEATRLVARTREEHLVEAKESYVRRVQTVVESWLPNALIGSTGPFDVLYPELEAWAKARSLDVSMQMGELVALLMRKELLSGAPLPPVEKKQEPPNGFMQVLKFVMNGGQPGQTIAVQVDEQASVEMTEEGADAEQPQKNEEGNDDGN